MNTLPSAILAYSLFFGAFVRGQMPPQPDDPYLEAQSSSIIDLNWHSVDRRTYFIQLSTNLSIWNYFPVTELGDGLPTAWSIATVGSNGHFLYRLRYTDVATTEPDLSDFDLDGIGNLAELRLPGEDPFQPHPGSIDSDSDGIPDVLEMNYFGSLTKSYTDDEDHDGIIDALELQAGQSPIDDQADDAGTRTNFSYDVMGRFEASEGDESFNPQFDAEGNLLSRE